MFIYLEQNNREISLVLYNIRFEYNHTAVPTFFKKLATTLKHTTGLFRPAKTDLDQLRHPCSRNKVLVLSIIHAEREHK